MFDQKAYQQFIASKGTSTPSHGFTPYGLPERLFAHQEKAVEFALSKGRSALFLDTGLGKSGCEAVFADQCAKHTGKPSLILTPLAVARQMIRECEAFGVEAVQIFDKWDVAVTPDVVVANYERLKNLDPSSFGAIILDESSILKSFTGSTKRALVEAFKETPFRLAATATPAPNDHMEIGQHSEFLGVMGSMEMLCRWFINDTSSASQEWRLKRHAKGDFWSWVSSWARAASLPSDLGGSDDGFNLPPLNTELHICDVNLTDGCFDGLFRIPSNSATDIHREKERTLSERVSRASDIANAESVPVIVWCERDDESAALVKAIPDAIEVKGSMTLSKKEAALDAFSTGQIRVLVSKPRIAGFGLNWQHARCQVFASLSHSYERYYQAVRRSWRFGQTEQATAHIVIAETETGIWRNIQRKSADHDRMKIAMSEAMRRAQRESHKKKYTRSQAVSLPNFARV
ncbi:helicase-related protein [uncultured Ruegeria sp.]|uniref:helicase-related protein n=1 Tax=uncultured Ruegeria sp. TaxID=259304 RepID=UPI002601A029|nr:helicase-related protein [uncultured Ruegeria sp.]